MTGKTSTGNRIKELRKEAAQCQRAINAAHRLIKAGDINAAAEIVGRQAPKRDQALRDAELLRYSGRARLEDIQVYTVERVVESKKGKRTNKYYYASWRRPGGRVFNKYLGSTKKIDHLSALDLARKLKAADLGIELDVESGTT
jgi:hypothetical protein